MCVFGMHLMSIFVCKFRYKIYIMPTHVRDSSYPLQHDSYDNLHSLLITRAGAVGCYEIPSLRNGRFNELINVSFLYFVLPTAPNCIKHCGWLTCRFWPIWFDFTIETLALIVTANLVGQNLPVNYRLTGC